MVALLPVLTLPQSSAEGAVQGLHSVVEGPERSPEGLRSPQQMQVTLALPVQGVFIVRSVQFLVEVNNPPSQCPNPISTSFVSLLLYHSTKSAMTSCSFHSDTQPKWWYQRKSSGGGTVYSENRNVEITVPCEIHVQQTIISDVGEVVGCPSH